MPLVFHCRFDMRCYFLWNPFCHGVKWDLTEDVGLPFLLPYFCQHRYHGLPDCLYTLVIFPDIQNQEGLQKEKSSHGLILIGITSLIMHSAPV